MTRQIPLLQEIADSLTRLTGQTEDLLEQEAPPEQQLAKTAFGELQTAEQTFLAQVQWPYNINSRITTARGNQSGTVGQSNGLLHAQTGAAINSSGVALSVVPIAYHPGQGVSIRFTAVFSPGVAGSVQYVGIGDAGDGLFFGCDGVDFGVMRRFEGVPEVRTLTVSVGSDAAENITITLDGDANSTVAVTNTGDTTLTANEIAAADYSDTGRGWTTHAMGATVVFVSWNAQPRSGTYSLSSPGASAGTFAQTIAGLVASEEFTRRSAWNVDKADGTGTLPELFPTNGNVYEIRFQWLGFGALEFLVENPQTGEFVLAHRVQYANRNTLSSIRNPSLPLCVEAVNTTNATNIDVHVGSMGGAIQGSAAELGIRSGSVGTNSAIETTELPILTLHNRQIYQSTINRTRVLIDEVTVSADATKSLTIRVLRDADLTGAVFADIDTNTSVMRADTTATAVAGGTVIDEITVQKQGSGTLRVEDIEPGHFVTFTAVAPSGTGHEAVIAASWLEEF